MNVTARLEFELVDFDDAGQKFSHYTPVTQFYHARSCIMNILLFFELQGDFKKYDKRIKKYL